MFHFQNPLTDIFTWLTIQMVWSFRMGSWLWHNTRRTCKLAKLSVLMSFYTYAILFLSVASFISKEDVSFEWALQIQALPNLFPSFYKPTNYTQLCTLVIPRNEITTCHCSLVYWLHTRYCWLLQLMGFWNMGSLNENGEIAVHGDKLSVRVHIKKYNI